MIQRRFRAAVSVFLELDTGACAWLVRGLLTLNDPEVATILAVLEYWKEEMCPHGHDSARPYWTRMKLGRIKPLAADEITRLSNRLRSNLRRRKKSDHGNQDS